MTRLATITAAALIGLALAHTINKALANVTAYNLERAAQ